MTRRPAPARRRGALVAVLLLLASACGGRAATTTSATTAATGDPVDIGAGLRGPDGLVATVASVGVANLAAIAEDDDGRLWLGTADFTDSGSDGVYLVTDATSDPQLVLADQHTVLGLLWLDGELYVASKERVDAYGGFDGSSFATHRTVVEFASGVGEVNGIALRSDGRLLVGISAPCDACEPTVAHGGAVVSFLPDGSDLRDVATGIRAPVGLAVVPGRADVLMTMNQRDDLGDATPPDALAVVVDGHDWNQPECHQQDGSACDGVPDPLADLDPHAAAGGVAVVDGTLGNEIGTVAVVAEWSRGAVVAVPLDETSATLEAGESTVLVDGVEKPMAVLAAADGSLVVGDWASGAVFRIATA